MINITFDYWTVFERGQAARRRYDLLTDGLERMPEPAAKQFMEPCDLKLIGAEAQAWEDGFEHPNFQRNSHSPGHHEALA